MLPTFVIGLREGLEAALIVGIIAAFLRKQGRTDLVRSVFLGVGAAVALCAAIGVGLELVSRDLPQRQQEGLETVIGVFAVGMVTYMVVWMRRHSRALKGQLEGLATQAINGGGSRSGQAMVAMAFLAVLREGLETVVFLLAAFNETRSNGSAAVGAVLGIAVAVALGYGIYRGGVRLNLSKFFRATGLVLVLVAAGLVVNALHTAHEAGWLNVGQGATFSLSWLVAPGSVRSSLLTGMLGLQPSPVQIEVIGWLVYLVPVGLYVGWPPGRGLAPRTTARLVAAGGALAVVAAGALMIVSPSQPASNPVTRSGAWSAQVVSRDGDHVVVRTRTPAAGRQLVDVALHCSGSAAVHAVSAEVCTSTHPVLDHTRTAHLDADQIVRLNGGRLPIGLQLGPGQTATTSTSTATALTVVLDPATGRVLDLRSARSRQGSVQAAGVGTLALSPQAGATTRLPAEAVSAAAASARVDQQSIARHSSWTSLAWLVGVLGLLALAGDAAAVGATTARRPRLAKTTPASMLVKN